MIKFLLFYGGIFGAVVVTVLVELFWRPQLIGRAICEESNQRIRCLFRTRRTLRPIRIKGIWIPVEYVEALDASPPKDFGKKPNRMTPVWPYDGKQREVLIWNGCLDLKRGKTGELVIPAKNPKAVSGTLHFSYEYRGVAGVVMASSFVDVPLEIEKV